MQHTLFVDVYIKDELVETFRGDTAYELAIMKYGYSNGRVAFSVYTVTTHPRPVTKRVKY